MVLRDLLLQWFGKVMVWSLLDVVFLEQQIQLKLNRVQFVVIMQLLRAGRFPKIEFDTYFNYLHTFFLVMLFMVVIQKRQLNVKLISGFDLKKLSHGTELALNIYMINTPMNNRFLSLNFDI